MNAIKVAAAVLCLAAFASSSATAAVTYSRDRLKAAQPQTAKDCSANQIFGRDQMCHDKTVRPTCPGGYSLNGAVCTYTG